MLNTVPGRPLRMALKEPRPQKNTNTARHAYQSPRPEHDRSRIAGTAEVDSGSPSNRNVREGFQTLSSNTRPTMVAMAEPMSGRVGP